jgi:hypothetical protein
MKNIFALLLLVSTQVIAYGQCSEVVVQISFSDTSQIQLYHAGLFLIPSGEDNICEWEVTTFTGALIHQETTSGGFDDQSFVSFTHDVPLSDSMKVTLSITNATEGITCTMNDTLIWVETEILPGSFIGDWTVLSSNGGVEEPISSAHQASLDGTTVSLFPSPASDYFQVRGKSEAYQLSILDLNGKVLATHSAVRSGDQIGIDLFPVGIYFVQILDVSNGQIVTKKIMKQ